MFREFDFETAPEKWYSSLVDSSENFFIKVTPRHRYQVLLSLFTIWKTTSKRFDSTLFSAASEAAFRNSLVNKNSFTGMLQSIDRNEAYYEINNAMEALPEIVTHEKEKGRTVGLKFGFYRRLTPPQIMELAIAGDYSDFLILILESGERTAKYKTDKIELTDQQRMKIFAGSGLVNFVGRTSGEDFSDNYYRELVEFIQPDVLFASSGWEKSVISEYKKRADSVNAKLISLPMISDFSTTYMEKFIF